LNPVKFEPKTYKEFSFTDDSIKYNPKSIDVENKVSDGEGQGY
jgi:hypothetical protein